MKDAIAALLAVFNEFTWRRFFGLLVVLAVLIGMFSWFESYTSTFRLSRLQKSADLLSKLQDMQVSFTNANPELKTNYQIIVEQTAEAIQIKPVSLDILPSKLHFSKDYVWQFLAGGAMWMVFALIYLITDKRDSWSDKLASVKGLTIVAVASGIGAIFVPPIRWPWFHLFIYPVLFALVVTALLLPIGYVANKRTADKNIQGHGEQD